MTAEPLDLLTPPLRARAAALEAAAYRSTRVSELLGWAVDAAFAGDHQSAEMCITQAEAAIAPAAPPVAKAVKKVVVAASMSGLGRTRPVTGDRSPKQIIQAGLQGRVRTANSEAVPVIATDGSVNGPYPGWGYLSNNGQWGCAAAVQSMPSQAPDALIASLVAELCAVGMAVKAMTGPLTFLVDSTGAIGYLQAWQKGDIARIPVGRANLSHGTDSGNKWQRRAARRRETLAAIAELIDGRGDITFTHVHGHRGHLLNEAADSLAKMASRWRREGDPGNQDHMVQSASDLASTFLESWQTALT